MTDESKPIIGKVHGIKFTVRTRPEKPVFDKKKADEKYYLLRELALLRDRRRK